MDKVPTNEHLHRFQDESDLTVRGRNSLAWQNQLALLLIHIGMG